MARAPLRAAWIAPLRALARPSALKTERARFLWRGGLLLALAAIWMAIDLPVFPIARWDESRLAVNAIEMHARGLSLVTTYGFRPDLWNTKPPLLIWLMSACMSAFGVSEGVLRIPSALATLGSAAIVMGFTWKLTRESFAPLAAGVVLLTTRGFVGRHSGQTADYEALLCFCITAYACLFFLTLHRARPQAWKVLLAFALVACAVLTKSVAGVVPGAGLGLYLLVEGRIWRPLRSWAYPAGGIAAAGVIAAFYLAREQAAPGYLHAVAVNELGRYANIVEKHYNPVWYYPLLIFGAFGFSLGVFALPLLAEVRVLRGRRRAGMIFSICMAFGIMGALTLSRTKIRWYTDPCHPFLAIGCALGLESVRQRLRAWRGVADGAPSPVWARVLVGAGAAVLVAIIFIVRDVYPTLFDGRTSGRYGAVFAALYARGLDRVEVRDDGVVNMENDTAYAPQLQFYAVQWAGRGLKVVRRAAEAPLTPGLVTASCDLTLEPQLARLGADLARTPGCIAVVPHAPGRLVGSTTWLQH